MRKASSPGDGGEFDPVIAEEVATGIWTVGVAVSGDASGLSREDLEALDDEGYPEWYASANRGCCGRAGISSLRPGRTCCR
ncbi:hypothetical protein [Microbaculum marinum]|uniref:Uncharacterized protein n=1 Tax=Microbaculum marinum TaxID=1764581 RepID=A0AAW9RBW0_9HYPH